MVALMITATGDIASNKPRQGRGAICLWYRDHLSRNTDIGKE